MNISPCFLAQKYMEEIESMKEFDTDSFTFNYDTGSYERDILQPDNSYLTKITIVPAGNMLYDIEVDVRDSNGTSNKLEGSKLFY